MILCRAQNMIWECHSPSFYRLSAEHHDLQNLGFEVAYTGGGSTWHLFVVLPDGSVEAQTHPSRDQAIGVIAQALGYGAAG